MKTEINTATTSEAAIDENKIPTLKNNPSNSSDEMQTAFDRWLINYVYNAIGRPSICIALWNGLQIGPSDNSEIATVLIKNRRSFLKIALYPDLFFGYAYSDGDVEVEGDLVGFLVTVYNGLSRAASPNRILKSIQDWLSKPRQNSRAGSRENIHRHYNIGNDFYKLWLDKKMVYTCAYFPTLSHTLEEAQTAKLDHICRKLNLRPGQSVVEAGCGWGSLALHMAQHYGVTVKAYNISKEQIKYARQRAKQEGLTGQVEFIEDDYRNINGQYDAFVSVGMLEHVGAEHFEQLGQIIQRNLKPKGYALLHFIGRNKPAPMNAWIEKQIFPGGYPPSLREALEITEEHNLSVLDIENLRLHYAKTLEHWLDRYEQHVNQVRDMFDDSFVRSWRLYLAGSIASFLTSDLQLFQISFVHAEHNDIPWTREYLYSQVSHTVDGSGRRAIS